MRLGEARIGLFAMAVAAALMTSGASASSARPVEAKGVHPNSFVWSANGVDVLPSGRAWAVGNVFSRSYHDRPWLSRWTGTDWRHSKAPHRYLGVLDDVDAVAADDVWAVGGETREHHLSLIEHWDGQSWRLSGDREESTAFTSVSATAPGDVWVAGSGPAGGVVRHWDGQQWQPVPRNSHGARFPSLRDVSAVAADDVWVTGSLQAFHWDGTKWRAAKLPTHRATVTLAGVSASSGSDVWLAGSTHVADQTVAVTFHWNGVRWQRVLLDQLPADRVLADVSVVAAGDAWVAGQGSTSHSATMVTARWDGRRWISMGAPDVPGQVTVTGLSAAADDDVWMTGYYPNPGSGFCAHWDGSTWTAYTPHE